MPISLRAKVALTLGGFLLLVAGPMVLAYRSSAAFLANSTEVVADQAAVAELRSVFSLLQELETGQRGYTLTGDEAFLTFYDVAHDQVLPRLRALRPLISITVQGPALADSLEWLAREKVDRMERVIEARRTRGFDAARILVADGRGRLLMDHIRTIVALVDAVAQRELVAARDQAADQRRTALLGLLASGLASIGLAVVAGFLISRDLAADRAQREQLRSQGDQLTSQLAGVSASLAAQDAQLRAIIAAVPVALVSIDRESRVTFWSPGAEKLFGWTSEEAMGRPLPNVSLERLEEHRRFRDSVLEGNAFSGRETRRRTKDGIEIDVALSIAPLINNQGETVGLVAAYVDVSDQRLLQEELRQSQKMEAVGRLAGAVAHDFNNLLTAILGFAERARRASPASGQHQSDLDQVVAAAERAAGLTHQLLTFSRPQAVTPKVIDVAEVVRSMDPMLRRLLGEQIDLRCVLSPDSGRVLADPHHLEQVLLNLCINARDAMPGGGRLVVETRTVDLQAPYLDQHPEIAPGAYCMLAVTDTGSGMDEAVQARIFEPFFTTKGGMGTGLGLATVHGIVKQAGGGILVYSEPGQGTTFKVFLPLTTRAASVTDVVSEPEAPLPTESIVAVVDDNSAVRSLAVALLEDEGFQVRAFASGEDALRGLTGTQAIDLLITDMVLGSMDGATLASQLRERYPGLPVIYMSGYTAEAAAVHGLSPQDRARFLDKPFRGATLLGLIADIMAEARSGT